MSKNLKKYFIVLAIVIVLFNIIYFVVPFPNKYQAAPLISYIFIFIALLSQYVFGYLSFYKDGLKSKFYGLPILKIGLIYLAIQAILGLIAMIVNCFIEIPAWIPVVAYIVILGLALIGLITTSAVRETIEATETENHIQIKTWKIIKAEADSLMLYVKFDSIKSKINELIDIIKYSDPVSCSELDDIENDIKEQLFIIKKQLKENQENFNLLIIDNLIDMVKERNIKCKAYK